MPKKEETHIWVSIDFTKSAHEVGGIRGRLSAADLKALLEGTLATPFVRVSDVYWFNDNFEDEEDWRVVPEKGTLVRYGEGRLSNYAGELWMRAETILNVAILKDGSEREEEPDEDNF